MSDVDNSEQKLRQIIVQATFGYFFRLRINQNVKIMYIKPSEKLLDRVWEKAKPISNENPDKYRVDRYGNWILNDDFKRKSSLLGWEICKIDPNSDSRIENLEPLFWKNVPVLAEY